MPGRPSDFRWHLMVPPRILDRRRWQRLRRNHLTQFLRIDLLRGWLARARYGYLRRTHGMRTFETNGATAISADTVPYNLHMLMKDFTVVRSQLLIRPLSVIEAVPPHADVLAIGPRSEGELLNLVAHGFEPERIRGLDLLSYSPWVDVGDMHAMPYDDGSFDVVVFGWALAYSSDPPAAVAEVLRVIRPGGIVAVGLEYTPLTDEELIATYGYTIGGPTRWVSTEQVLELFGDRIGEVYFRHDPARNDEVGAIAAIFLVTSP